MLRTCERRIRSLSLRRKILLLAVGVEIFLILAASLLGLTVLDTNRDLLSQTMAGALQYSADQLKQYIDQVKALTDQIYASNQVQQELIWVASDEDVPERRNAYHALYDLLLGFMQAYPSQHIRYISIITDAFTVTAGGEVSNRPPEEVLSQLYALAQAQEGRAGVASQWNEQYGLMVYRSVRRIRPLTLDTLGVLVVCLDTEQLVKDATTFNNEYEECLYLLTENGSDFYRSAGLSEQDAHAIQEAVDGDHGTITLNGHHYFVQRGQVADYGWDSVCVVSFDRQWNTMRGALLTYLGVLLATLLLAIAVSGKISRSISHELVALEDRMRAFRGQTLPAQGDMVGGTDEVAALHRHFDHMAEEITQLIQDKYVSELLTKDAQLSALEAQINPHFLYNVLDSINWRARNAGLTDVSEIVDSLGRYLRVSLNRQRKLITLREELELVDCYVIIQRYRFEEHLRYTCRVPERLLDVHIPKLVIQPLVENAVKYAVETSLDDCVEIIVEAEETEGLLQIDVKNSGSELEGDLLVRLKNGDLQPHGFGIGLTNIDARLRLTFGEDRGLRLFNQDGYAVCRLTLPQAKEDDHAATGDRG